MKNTLMVLLLAAAAAGSTLLAAPVVLASVFAGFAGVMVMTQAGIAPTSQSSELLPLIARSNQDTSAVKVFELDGGGGVVIFRHIDGKLVSRFYRSRV